MEAPKSPVEVVQALNRAWREEDASALAALLMPEVIVLTSSLEVAAEGREKTVESYLAFAREGRVKTFEEYDWREYIVGPTAVAAYRYRIEYERDGRWAQDQGNEVFWLLANGSSWWAACRLALFSG